MNEDEKQVVGELSEGQKLSITFNWAIENLNEARENYNEAKRVLLEAKDNYAQARDKFEKELTDSTHIIDPGE